MQADAIYTEKTNGNPEDFSVDIVMESKGAMTETGYTVEVRIPFKSLRYEAGENKLWGVHFLRRIKRFNNELDSWMPISREISGTLNQTGHITGLSGISIERTLELIPSLTVSETGKRVHKFPIALFDDPANANLYDPGRFVNKPLNFDPGLTGKIGLTPTVTLDFTLNPDFAQVEADQTVLTANQRFPIFFEEKRPFFLEGKDYFDTPMNILNTRAIVSPDYAVKLTGKRGRNTFGALYAADSAPGNYSDDERDDPNARPYIAPFLDKDARILALRFKRDISGKDSNIGVMATSYDFGVEPEIGHVAESDYETAPHHNRVVSVDGRLRIDPKTIFTFQVVGAASRRYFYNPDLDENIYRRGDAFGYAAIWDFSGRNWGYTLSAVGRTRDYRADVGFTRRVNTNNEKFFARYSTNPKPKAKLVSWRVLTNDSINHDFKGRLQNVNLHDQINFDLQRQTYIEFGVEGGYERVFEEEFGAKREPVSAAFPQGRQGAFAGASSERSARYHTFYAYAETTPSKKYSISGFMSTQRGALDYDFGAGPKFPRVSPAALLDQSAPCDPGAGYTFDAELHLKYRPTDALQFSLDYNKNKLTRYDTGRVAFNSNIVSLRSTYQFTRFTFARARVDYDSIQSNFRGQFLVGYTPNPGTAFYVGYNDDMNYRGYNYLNPNAPFYEPGLRRNTRTFFIKASYLIRRSLSKN